MSGPGTELANMLHSLWIRAKPECPCKLVAELMDSWGVDGIRDIVTEADIDFMRQWIARQPVNAILSDWLVNRCDAVGEDTRFDMVLDCLHEEASRRRLPFNRTLASLLVRKAIHRARLTRGTL
jgi:hypothetical protein